MPLSGVTGALAGSLFVGDNSQLESLAGLGGITAVGGQAEHDDSIHIWHNAKLVSVDGLDGISGTVPGAIKVEDNAMLRNLDGLRNIKDVGKNQHS